MSAYISGRIFEGRNRRGAGGSRTGGVGTSAAWHVRVWVAGVNALGRVTYRNQIVKRDDAGNCFTPKEKKLLVSYPLIVLQLWLLTLGFSSPSHLAAPSEPCQKSELFSARGVKAWSVTPGPSNFFSKATATRFG